MRIQEISHQSPPKISSLTHFQFNLLFLLAAQKKWQVTMQFQQNISTEMERCIIQPLLRSSQCYLITGVSIEQYCLVGYIVLWLSSCRISFLEISKWISSQSFCLDLRSFSRSLCNIYRTEYDGWKIQAGQMQSPGPWLYIAHEFCMHYESVLAAKRFNASKEALEWTFRQVGVWGKNYTSV